MESEDEQLKQLFQRTNREFEFDAKAIRIPAKRWFYRRPYNTTISVAASMILLVSGSVMFPVSESMLEWSSYSFEYYKKGIEFCMAAISQSC